MSIGNDVLLAGNIGPMLNDLLPLHRITPAQKSDIKDVWFEGCAYFRSRRRFI